MGKKRSKKQMDIDITDLRFYYGIPHCHTALSTGRGKPYEALELARKNGLDYMVITDHNNYLKENVYDRNESLDKWRYLLKSINKFNKKHDDFIAIQGFETHSDPWGDLNIINSNSYFTGTVDNLNGLVLWMIGEPNALVSINHPHKSIEKLDFNPVINYFLRTIEVGNGSPPNKYSRHEKYYFNLLDKGWQIGAINSQDNHRLNFGESENLTCAVCNKFDKKSILSAFKKNNTFSTESKTLKLYFTVNSIFMGGEIPFSEETVLDFYIYAEDSSRKIEKIQIISSNGKVIKEISNISLNTVKYLYSKDCNSFEKWYVVKIFLEDKRLALSSPVFIKQSD